MITMAMFSHILLTRFNTRTSNRPAPDSRWLAHRFDLFDKYTFPSVRNQSNLNFIWLVFFDSETPIEFRGKIATYAQWEKFVPCFIDELEIGLDAPQVVSPFVRDNIHPDSKYLITTRIDNDDAVSIDFIESVQHEFSEQPFEFVNFLNGYALCKKKLYRKRGDSNPFLSLIELIDDLRTVWYQAHRKVNQVGKVRQIKSKPMWLQVIHGKNVSNKVLMPNMRVPLQRLGQDFQLGFSLDAGSENLFFYDWTIRRES